jgi:hypothetical protein
VLESRQVFVFGPVAMLRVEESSRYWDS